MAKKSISVVIPNYNGKELLQKNLPSVFTALKQADIDFEVIVSDDASTDNSVAFLKENYPSVIVVTNKINRGFAPNVNCGIKIAQKDLILILNSDVQLTAEYFLPQFKFFQNEDTFGVMGRIVDFQSGVIQDAAKYPRQTWLKKIIATENFIVITNHDANKTWVPTFFLSGANALVDRDKLQKIGGFDELFAPFYGEDADLGLKAWRLGWKCYYEHNAICKHATSSTILRYRKKKLVRRIALRNKFILHAIHLEGTNKMIWNIKIMIDLLIRWLTLQTVYYLAFFDFLRIKSKVKLSKQHLREIAKVNDLTLKTTTGVIVLIKGKIHSLQIKKF